MKADVMRPAAVLIGILVLTACQEPIPDSGYNPALRGDTSVGLPAQINVEAEPLDAVSMPQSYDENGNLIAGTLSDENDFEAVSNRQTIESDAERLAENRSRYISIGPTDLPVRPGTDIPNIVAYALQTNNPLKTQLYDRGPFASEKRALANCNAYPSPGKAQEVFLSKGGPKRDRYGLDPDGDGFACTWDPTPFRLARSEG